MAGLNLVQPHRYFVREGSLLKSCRQVLKKRYFYLFNDLLIYGVITATSAFSIRKHHELVTLEVADMADTEAVQHAFTVKTPKKAFAVSCVSVEDKRAWFDDMSKNIREQQDRKHSFGAFAETVGTSLSSALDEQQPAFCAPVWQNDHDAKKCTKCGLCFSVVNRRHHCRMCGFLVCAECSKQRVLLPDFDSGKHRVCDECAEKVLAAEPSGTNV
eukprot:TRINITY_DN4754_c0_g1_i4.p1 TRINITY_DN4754_c0_g1~~TRINITY_DN4754_c0_g1_i4.p1  ORF type:complete len:215 (-),score=54.21 TRINITY_DN4754_c0_g1_i4:69-713(-)